MQTALSTARPNGKSQFALAGLIEFVTVCAILARLSPYVGIATSIFLVLMALALAAKQGMLALTLWGAASLAADGAWNLTSDDDLLRQVMVLLVAGALCTWYRVRRKPFSER